MIRDHGRPENRLTDGVDDARGTLLAFEQAGFSMKDITGRLLKERLQLFKNASIISSPRLSTIPTATHPVESMEMPDSTEASGTRAEQRRFSSDHLRKCGGSVRAQATIQLRGRRVLSVHLGLDVQTGLEILAKAMEHAL
jgi:hypothetical protein